MYVETRYTAEEAAKKGDEALKNSNAVAGSKIMGVQVTKLFHCIHLLHKVTFL